MRLRSVCIAVLIGVATAGVASCGGGAGSDAVRPQPSTASSPPSAKASPATHRPAAGDDCVTYQAGGRPVYFGPDSSLAGYLYGSGTVGIVFAHQSDGDACDWMPEAARLAKLGYRTLAVDLDG